MGKLFRYYKPLLLRACDFPARLFNKLHYLEKRKAKLSFKKDMRGKKRTLPVVVPKSFTVDFPPKTASKSTLIVEEVVFCDAE